MTSVDREAVPPKSPLRRPFLNDEARWSRAHGYRVACLSIPDLPVEAERSRRPELTGVPVVLLSRASSTDSGAGSIVAYCSAEARAQGVSPGMSVRQVWAECPNAVILPPNPGLYRELNDRFLDALEKVAPVVEEAGLGYAYVDLSGMEYLHPDVRALLRTMIEVASSAVGNLRATACAGPNKFVAGVAAALGADARQREEAWAKACAEMRKSMLRLVDRQKGTRQSGGDDRCGFAERFTTEHARGAVALLRSERMPKDERFSDVTCDVTLIPARGARAFLAPLSVRYLPVSENMQSRLADFGLRRMGQIVQLGVTAMQAQFGREGWLAWRLSQGIDDEPVVQRRTFRPIAESLSYHSPITEWAVFWVALRQLLVRVWRRVERKGAVQQVELLARIEGQTWSKRFTFHEPVGERERLESILHHRLQGQTLPGAIIELTFQITALAGRYMRQGDLFDERSDLSGRLRRALAPLKARHGSTQLYRIVEVEPWSRIPERRYALISFDP